MSNAFKKSLLQKISFVTASLAIAALSVTACSSSSISDSTAKSFQLREFKETTMANGLRVLWIPDQSLPRTSLQLLVQVGSINDPKGLEGLNAMTASLMDQGTSKKSAIQIADDLGQLGTEIGQSPSYDYSMVSTSSLSSDREKLLNIFADVVLNPSFLDKEIDRVRKEFIASLQRMVDQPSSFADLKMDEILYRDHPYSKPVSGDIESLKKINRSLIMRHYFKYYRPNNAILAVTGQFDADFQKKVESAMGKWAASKLENGDKSSLSEVPRQSLVLFTKPDLKQTQIRFAQLGIERKDPDFLRLRLANMVFGGSFASRLNQRVRDDLGLTYSISSSADSRIQRGSLEISTFTRHEKTKEVISETMSLLNKFAKDGIEQKELDAAKAVLIGQFPSAIETVDRLAMNLLILRRYDISDDYLKSFNQNVQNISLDQVNEAIRKHYDPKTTHIVVYSDKKQTFDQLKSIGDIEVRDVK